MLSNRAMSPQTMAQQGGPQQVLTGPLPPAQQQQPVVPQPPVPQVPGQAGPVVSGPPGVPMPQPQVQQPHDGNIELILDGL